MMNAAVRCKETADQFYRNKSYSSAVEDYSKAIALLAEHNDQDLIYICYSNRCACFLQLKRFSEALFDAQQCVELKPEWHKGYLRLGSCFRSLGRIDDAIAAYEQVLSYSPNNSEARSALNSIQNGGSSSYYSSGQSSSSSSNNSRSTNSNVFHSNYEQLKQYFNTIDYQQITQNIAHTLSTTAMKIYSYYLNLPSQTKQYLQMGIVALLVYYFFVNRSMSSYYYDDHSYYGCSNNGLSWTAWGMIMFAAYKLPPLFPDALGDYARPFFGLNWTTFMWLVNMLTSNRSYGRPYIPHGGMFGGPRAYRRYY